MVHHVVTATTFTEVAGDLIYSTRPLNQRVLVSRCVSLVCVMSSGTGPGGPREAHGPGASGAPGLATTCVVDRARWSGAVQVGP